MRSGFTCVSRGLSQASLTGQDAPHAANVDLARPDGPEDGSGTAVPDRHAAEHLDRIGPT